MIVIEGLAMPKGEDDGILIALYDGKAHKIGTKETFTASEVPVHGRLIDADALEASCFMGSSSFYTQSDIDYAPTIIRAEPPKEETT